MFNSITACSLREGCELHTKIYLENLKRRDHMVEVGVGVDASALRRWMNGWMNCFLAKLLAVVLLCSAHLSDGSTRQITCKSLTIVLE